MGKETKIQDEPWYRQLSSELRRYKQYKARIGVLEARMIRQCGPGSKVLASYGGVNAGAPTVEDTDEQELEQLNVKVTSIECALGALTETERKIIELKFFERHRDVIIYEMELPMSTVKFYKELGNAMILIKEILSKEKSKSF